MALNGNIETGSMTVNTDININLDPGKTYGIPNGYHSGNSTISVISLASQTPANATDDDIISPYKGWVNGSLVTGNMIQRTAYTNYTNMIRESNSNYYVVFSKGAYLEKSGYDDSPSITIPQEMVASIGEVTQDKIAKGKSYLGRQGTYTADATVTANDIKLGYTAYSNGELIVGALKTTNIRNVGLTVNSNSVIISWNNPAVGPYQGTRIRISTTEYPGTTGGTLIYEGSGSNTQPDGRSSVTITDLTFGQTYYFSVYSYCGTLSIGDVYNLDKAMYTTMTTGSSFNGAINKSALAFAISPTAPPNGAPIIDVSNGVDGSIVTWFDDSNNIQYIYTQYQKIYLNQNSSSMFQGCNYTTIDLSLFDTSKVLYMDNMFEGCIGVLALDLSTFNVSNVTSMSNVFRSCQEMTSLNITGWNTPNVTNMSGIFSDCRKLESINISSFNTSKVTDMRNMFYNAYALKSINVSNFNTSNVLYMNSMFSHCYAITTLDLSKFNTSKVTTMASMISTCSKLATLNISSFNTSSVTSMAYMFSYTGVLQTITYGSTFVNTKLPSVTINMFKASPANKPDWSDGTWNGEGDFTKN